MRKLSLRLSNLRKARGKTLRQVESATGVSNPLISQIESGHVKNPGVFTVAKLAKFYGVTLDRLLSK